MTQQTTEQRDGQQPSRRDRTPVAHPGSPINPELVDKLIDTNRPAEYRLQRGDQDELFEGLHDKTSSLTVLNETDVRKRDFGLMIEEDLLSMHLPRRGSPWSGDLRAELTGDEDDRLEAPSEIAMQRNYRRAMDQARQSREGGTLLKRLTQILRIQDVRDNQQKKKKKWYKRLFPTRGGSE